ncbi:aminotransferase class V-fold PLP-dependent enzyme [Gillisia sp. M10.2A]|uniref:Aminotransferase class V-fold PLP-dependent enzyme n=1 Tax=Gillisia lutea TaxID=2909668 RepID=A0ABS9EGG4_9FLAO|nr:aminotransferase class V-fold PLP-dependent enzyme [Gillisia lutea]MCF4101951.1 aminotransferase class V-fold PLP-dependent enzyme [Gillisia lutea]
MKNLRKAFPVLQQYIYLNTAASGPLSEKVFDFRQEHDLDFLVSGCILKEKQGEMLAKIRETVGGFFKCEPNRVALVPNFSYGFNTLLEGIESDKSFLLLEDEYPSISWPITSREFKTYTVSLSATLEEDIENALKNYNPDVFAFSIVQYISGLKLSIDFLKQMKQKFPDTLFIADGTQYCGTEIFNFDDSGLDVLLCSGYKWLNAGYGNGFVLFQEDVPKKIFPKTTGFNSLQGKYKAQEGNFLGKFEPGHQDTLNYGSLMTALKYLNEVNLEVVEEINKKLSVIAKKELTTLGVLDEIVVKRSHHSTIFNIKGDKNLYDHLRNNDILASLKGPGIRVSFHYYNTEEEIQELVKALSEYLKK